MKRRDWRLTGLIAFGGAAVVWAVIASLEVSTLRQVTDEQASELQQLKGVVLANNARLIARRASATRPANPAGRRQE